MPIYLPFNWRFSAIDFRIYYSPKCVDCQFVRWRKPVIFRGRLGEIAQFIHIVHTGHFFSPIYIFLLCMELPQPGRVGGVGLIAGAVTEVGANGGGGFLSAGVCHIEYGAAIRLVLMDQPKTIIIADVDIGVDAAAWFIGI